MTYGKYLKDMGFKGFFFALGLLCFGLFSHQRCFAQILDKDGTVLEDVVGIFRQYKPLIEERAADIVQQKKLPKEEIDKVLSSVTPASTISLKILNAIAQIVFLRPNGLERKDMKHYNEKFVPYTGQEVLKLFVSIGDIKPVYPQQEAYRYILLNGSTVQNMRQRLKTLVDLVETKKIRIGPETKVVFLTGDRDLFAEEDEAQLMDSNLLGQDPSWVKPDVPPVNEAEAAHWIWAQSKLPDSLRGAAITFVQAQKKVDPKTGKSVRPTTLDTVIAWVNGNNPEPGACLSVSSQPFVFYQEVTIRGVFKKAGLLERGFSVEGVGSGIDNESLEHFQNNIAVVLDNLARTIYTEVQNNP